MLAQTDEVPVFGIIVRTVQLDILFNGFFDHALYIIAYVFTVENLCTL